MDEQQTVIGTIASVIYQNDENGYAVVRLATEDGELITLVGCLPCPAPGESLSATGGFVVHPAHGEQFAAAEIERRMPADEGAILDFLGSGVIRGIGPATAQRLVERFGADTLDVIENEPEKLAALKGFTARRAREIAVSFREQMGLRRLTEFLSRFELPTSLAVPLCRRFGADAMDALRANPYVLAAEPFSLDFALADEIALALGFAGGAGCRIEAAILFELTHNEAAGGHVFLPRDKLIAATARLLDEPPDTVEKSLDDLIESARIVQEPVANVVACYLARCRADEDYVAARVRAMLSDTPDLLHGADKTIEEISREQGVVYAPLQRLAVKLAARTQLLILTGGPGTGKTTTVRAILTLYERMGLDVLLAAPTGRAAKRMGEVCGRDAQTIHRLLGMSWDERTGAVKFQKNERDPLKADAVIVDESSMVDLALMRAFLAALRPGCRLVLVGDPDQLPSVGAGSVFSDLIRSRKVETIALRDVFRQASRSAIIRNAHAVNKGWPPELQNSPGSDFFFLLRRDPVRLVDTVVDLCKTRLPDKMGIPAADIQVLTPTRRGPTGTAALNRALQAALNPPAEGRNERRFGDVVFREGDRVMQTRNDYDVVWERADGTAGTGVFNGDVGRILRIEPGGDLIRIAFDDRVALYSADMLAELDIAYAMTVHKAQGSEYPGVVFVSAPCAPGLEVRGVLYTAITRARSLLVAVGDDATIARMAENDRRQRRYSGLRWRLADDPTQKTEG